MVAGHLQEKNGTFYMVLCYPGADGKSKSKWITTKLPVKGNKKKSGRTAAANKGDIRSTGITCKSTDIY